MRRATRSTPAQARRAARAGRRAITRTQPARHHVEFDACCASSATTAGGHALANASQLSTMSTTRRLRAGRSRCRSWIRAVCAELQDTTIWDACCSARASMAITAALQYQWVLKHAAAVGTVDGETRVADPTSRRECSRRSAMEIVSLRYVDRDGVEGGSTCRRADVRLCADYCTLAGAWRRL